MDHDNDEVFRQNITVGTKHYGKVGFTHQQGKDYLQIISFSDGYTDKVEFSLEAIPQLIALLVHAYSTKNKPTEDDTYAFPRLEEKV